MKDWQSQAHVKWECKYHVVIVPKYRKKVMYGKMRRNLGGILRQLCRQKDVELVEGMRCQIMFICCSVFHLAIVLR